MPGKSKSNQKIYIYDEDWKDISDYFSLIKGKSTLTKTAALREVIHTWTNATIRPALQKIRNPQSPPSNV